MYLTTAQACARLGISRWTLAQRIKAGEIQAVKGTAKNAHLRIPESSVTDYIERHTLRPAAGAA